MVVVNNSKSSRPVVLGQNAPAAKPEDSKSPDVDLFEGRKIPEAESQALQRFRAEVLSDGKAEGEGSASYARRCQNFFDGLGAAGTQKLFENLSDQDIAKFNEKLGNSPANSSLLESLGSTLRPKESARVVDIMGQQAAIPHMNADALNRSIAGGSSDIAKLNYLEALLQRRDGNLTFASDLLKGMDRGPGFNEAVSKLSDKQLRSMARTDPDRFEFLFVNNARRDGVSPETRSRMALAGFQESMEHLNRADREAGAGKWKEFHKAWTDRATKYMKADTTGIVGDYAENKRDDAQALTAYFKNVREYGDKGDIVRIFDNLKRGNAEPGFLSGRSGDARPDALAYYNAPDANGGYSHADRLGYAGGALVIAMKDEVNAKEETQKLLKEIAGVGIGELPRGGDAVKFAVDKYFDTAGIKADAKEEAKRFLGSLRPIPPKGTGAMPGDTAFDTARMRVIQFAQVWNW